MLRALFASLILTAACSGSDASGPDAAEPFTLACETHATTFPTLDKSCTTAADCVLVTHQISCCGTLVSLGLAASSASTFATSEQACAAGYPGCGCASQPTAAEDGRDETDGTIAVRCVEQRCASYVP